MPSKDIKSDNGRLKIIRNERDFIIFKNGVCYSQKYWEMHACFLLKVFDDAVHVKVLIFKDFKGKF